MSIRTLNTSDLEARLQELLKKHGLEDDTNETKEVPRADFAEVMAVIELKHDLTYCWEQNGTLIHHEDFSEFCMDTLYEIGDLKKGGVADGLIDPDKAAEIMEQDYRLVTFMGEDYWIRN